MQIYTKNLLNLFWCRSLAPKLVLVSIGFTSKTDVGGVVNLHIPQVKLHKAAHLCEIRGLLFLSDNCILVYGGKLQLSSLWILDASVLSWLDSWTVNKDLIEHYYSYFKDKCLLVLLTVLTDHHDLLKGWPKAVLGLWISFAAAGTVGSWSQASIHVGLDPFGLTNFPRPLLGQSSDGALGTPTAAQSDIQLAFFQLQ